MHAISAARLCTCKNGKFDKDMQTFKSTFLLTQGRLFWQVIQTCAVACFSLAFTGGFTNYLVAMDWNTYIQVDGANSEGVPGKPVFPLPPSVVEPSYGALLRTPILSCGMCLPHVLRVCTQPTSRRGQRQIFWILRMSEKP